MRYFALPLKSLGKQFLTPFHVDALLFIDLAELPKQFLTLFHVGALLALHLKGLAKQFLTPFHVDALALAPEVDKMGSRRLGLGIF